MRLKHAIPWLLGTVTVLACQSKDTEEPDSSALKDSATGTSACGEFPGDTGGEIGAAATLSGNEENEFFGLALATEVSTPIPYVFVGAPGLGYSPDSESYRGSVIVHEISSGGFSPEVAATISGLEDDAIGRALTLVADEEGPILVVGAPGRADAGEDAGGAYLFRLPVSGELDVASADVALDGLHAGDDFGRLVSSSDVDGDGRQDLLVSATQYDAEFTGSGAAFIFNAATLMDPGDASDVLMVTGSDATEFPSALAGGDINDDGFEDLTVGHAETNDRAGTVWVFLGPIHENLTVSQADYTAVGASSDLLGDDVVVADLDGDGAAELAVGAAGEARNEGSGGNVYILEGPWSGIASVVDARARLLGEDQAFPAERIGLTVLGDASGRPRLAAGFSQNDGAATDAGAIFIVPGSLCGTWAINEVGGRFDGTGGGALAGEPLLSTDLDADGTDELLVGAIGESTVAEDAGAVYLLDL